MKFGWEIDAYNITDVAEYVQAVSKADTDALVEEYYASYDILLEGRDEKEFRDHVAVQAQQEIFKNREGGLRYGSTIICGHRCRFL